MKHLFLTVVFFLPVVLFAQEDDIRMTPALEKKLKQDIEKGVSILKLDLKKKGESDLTIEFAIDTFRIEQYLSKYIKYEPTTAGTRIAGYEAADQYNALLNKYYKRLLTMLKPEDKKVLMQDQKTWTSYRDSELNLSGILSKEEYSVDGGTINQATEALFYLELIKNRTIAIITHLRRATEGY